MGMQYTQPPAVVVGLPPPVTAAHLDEEVEKSQYPVEQSLPDVAGRIYKVNGKHDEHIYSSCKHAVPMGPPLHTHTHTHTHTTMC